MGDSDWDESGNMDTVDKVKTSTQDRSEALVAGKRSNVDDQDQGTRRRRNNNQDENTNTNQDGGNTGFRRRNREDNGENTNNQENQGPRRRRDNSQGNQDGGNGGFRRRNRDENGDKNMDVDQAGGGERRRRNRDDKTEDAPTRATVGENGEKKENYIPHHYGKEDEELFDKVGEGINFAKYDKIPVQVSGENIPDPIQRFSDIAKDPSVVEAVKRSGYHTLTPIQKYGISIIMNDRDLMASAQTGSGKTMAFLLPIVEKLLRDPSYKDYGEKCEPQALIITPTRELAIQIYEQATKLTFKNELKTCVVYGGTNFADQRNRINYGANIVVATPGRLNHFLEKEMMSLNKLKFFVLDEADRMIDQGFIPAVRRVVGEFGMSSERLTMMFSATFPNEVQRLAQEFLKPDYIFLSVGALGQANSDVKQEIRQVEFRQKKDELIKILADIYKPDERILIFCEKKKMADFLAANLCDRDYKTTSIHGDRLQSQREQALKSFRKGETPIMVATSVAARGLDIKGVGYVINYDLPSEIEEYVHRIGRTGRVGNSGVSISFYNEKDNSAIAPNLTKMLAEAGQSIPDFLSSYDDGNSFSNDNNAKDTRHDNVDKSANFSNRTDNYVAPATVEEDDW